MKKILWCVSTGLTAVLASGSMAAAQDPAAANSGQPADGSTGIAEVVVTAQRRAENIQRVPSSIAVVSGETLAQQGRTQLDDVLKTIPAAAVDTGPRGFLVRLRGVGLDLPPTVGDPSVSVAKDDIIDDRTETTKAGFYDIDRMEVLRGPQGTLYGRNATGGAVNVISKNPVLGRTESYALGEVGDYDLRHVEGAINLPASDVLAFRLAGSYLDREGYLSNGSNDNVAWAIRGKALYRPSDAVSLLAGVEYTDIGGKGSSSVPAFGTSQPADPYDNTTPIFRVAGPPFFGYGRDGFLDGRNQKYYGRADIDVGLGVLTILPAIQIYDEDYKYAFAGSATPTTYTRTIVKETQKSGEVRLASQPDSAFKWVVGAFAYSNHNYEIPVGAVAADDYDYHREVETAAVFGQATYPLSDTLRLTAGVRQTHDRKRYVSFDAVTTGNQPSTTTPPAVQGCPRANPCVASKSWSNFDYKAGVEWDASPNSLVYATVSSGFASGGYNFNANRFFEPETITAFEVGSKNRFADNRVQLNGSLYYYDFKNYQASEQLLNPPGTNPPFYLNVNTASARSYGGEIESQFALTSADRLSVGIAYLNARFKTFQGAGNQIYNNTDMPNSPEWTVTAAYDHIFDLGRGMTLTPHVNTRYVSEYILVYAAPPSPPAPAGETIQPKRFTTDAALTLAFDGGRWSVTANVKNIENDAVKAGVFGPFDVAVLAPRTYSLVVTTRF